MSPSRANGAMKNPMLNCPVTAPFGDRRPVIRRMVAPAHFATGIAPARKQGNGSARRSAQGANDGLDHQHADPKAASPNVVAVCLPGVRRTASVTNTTVACCERCIGGHCPFDLHQNAPEENADSVWVEVERAS